MGDANKDGNIDLGKSQRVNVGVSFTFSLWLWTDEWLDVMNDIIGGLKDKNEFPEWYEGLHKALFRANEFLGTCEWSWTIFTVGFTVFIVI